MKKREVEALCPAAQMLALLGERHVLMVIYHLISGSKGFNNLQDIMDINTATLSKRLNQLESENLVEKIPCPNDFRRSYYTLTKRGKELSKLIKLFSKI